MPRRDGGRGTHTGIAIVSGRHGRGRRAGGAPFALGRGRRSASAAGRSPMDRRSLTCEWADTKNTTSKHQHQELQHSEVILSHSPRKRSRRMFGCYSQEVVDADMAAAKVELKWLYSSCAKLNRCCLMSTNSRLALKSDSAVAKYCLSMSS